MAEKLEVTAILLDDKVQFSGSARNNPEVLYDYRPPIGDGNGYTGLEGLLMSFAACSGTAVVFLLRRMNKNITSLKVIGEGIRKDTLPASFKEITVEFVIGSDNTAPEDVLNAIKMSEEQYCPVWDMIRNNVVINTKFQIISD